LVILILVSHVNIVLTPHFVLPFYSWVQC